MKPFRKNVALSVDGGGIRGALVARALAVLEEYLSKPAHEVFRLVAGTSTGAIISASIGAGLTGTRIHQLYTDLGERIFRKTCRSRLWPLTRYRYPLKPLEEALREYIGDIDMGEFWSADPRTDVVITVFDLVENRTRFVKPWKENYAKWPVIKAVLASSSIPTTFPPVEGRFVDGGVGSYYNPCYVAAYELCFCLEWDPAETTLLSLGTGRYPSEIKEGEANKWYPWQWIGPTVGAFMQSADEQQVRLVDTFFKQLDFRRYQVDFSEPIEPDDASKIPELTSYGEELGNKIIGDQVDTEVFAVKAGRPRQR